jgi:hypothetical protein
MLSYTKLSYAEASSRQIVDNSLYLAGTMLYNLDDTPRILATLNTHSYKKLELKIGFLLNSEDFENLLIFIKNHLASGATATITQERSFNTFIAKITIDKHKKIEAELGFSYNAQLVNEDGEVLRKVQLNKLTDIAKNSYLASFVTLTIRALQ